MIFYLSSSILPKKNSFLLINTTFLDQMSFWNRNILGLGVISVLALLAYRYYNNNNNNNNNNSYGSPGIWNPQGRGVFGITGHLHQHPLHDPTTGNNYGGGGGAGGNGMVSPNYPNGPYYPNPNSNGVNPNSPYANGGNNLPTGGGYGGGAGAQGFQQGYAASQGYHPGSQGFYPQNNFQGSLNQMTGGAFQGRAAYHNNNNYNQNGPNGQGQISWNGNTFNLPNFIQNGAPWYQVASGTTGGVSNPFSPSGCDSSYTCKVIRAYANSGVPSSTNQPIPTGFFLYSNLSVPGNPGTNCYSVGIATPSGSPNQFQIYGTQPVTYNNNGGNAAGMIPPNIPSPPPQTPQYFFVLAVGTSNRPNSVVNPGYGWILAADGPLIPRTGTASTPRANNVWLLSNSPSLPQNFMAINSALNALSSQTGQPIQLTPQILTGGTDCSSNYFNAANSPNYNNNNNNGWSNAFSGWMGGGVSPARQSGAVGTAGGQVGQAFGQAQNYINQGTGYVNQATSAVQQAGQGLQHTGQQIAAPFQGGAVPNPNIPNANIPKPNSWSWNGQSQPSVSCGGGGCGGAREEEFEE
jgi:hypothetical protein